MTDRSDRPGRHDAPRYPAGAAAAWNRQMDNGKQIVAAARDAAIQQLNVGTRVQLRVQRDGGQQEYFSSLVGFVKDEFLLVKSPMLRKMPVVLHDGEPVQVRAFTGTTIYSFSAT